MKEVKIKTTKQNLYLTIFNQIKAGKNPRDISKELSISKQKINYYTSKLQEKCYIKKVGYGTWEVQKQTLSTLDFSSNKSIRGHAFIWTVKVPKEIKGDWITRLKNKKYSLVGKEKFPRIIIKGKKVWLGKKNIVIYENKSFYGKKSTTSRKYAVESLISCLQALECFLCVNLKPYTFKVSREHYGMIKNDLAIQCNKNKEKILIHDDLEGDWLWIDDSESLGELETGGKKAVVRSKQVQDWYNDHKKHNFGVTPSFILNSLAQSQQQLTQFQQQIKSHLNLIKEYRKENKAWRITKEKEIVKQTKEQKTLGDFK